MAHHRVTKILRLRIGRFYLTHDAQDMLALFSRSEIAAQYRIAGLQLVDVGDALDDLRQVRRRHHTAGPFAVLRMVRELYGIEGPDIGTQAAHRELGGTVAGVAKHHV